MAAIEKIKADTIMVEDETENLNTVFTTTQELYPSIMNLLDSISNVPNRPDTLPDVVSTFWRPAVGVKKVNANTNYNIEMARIGAITFVFPEQSPVNKIVMGNTGISGLTPNFVIKRAKPSGWTDNWLVITFSSGKSIYFQCDINKVGHFVLLFNGSNMQVYKNANRVLLYNAPNETQGSGQGLYEMNVGLNMNQRFEDIQLGRDNGVSTGDDILSNNVLFYNYILNEQDIEILYKNGNNLDIITPEIVF